MVEEMAAWKESSSVELLVVLMGLLKAHELVEKRV
jgi:hypothetical protein